MTTDLDIFSEIRLLLETVNHLDVDAISDLPTADALTAWAALEESHRVLGQVRSAVTHLLAEAMPEKQHVVMGVGTFIRHGKRDRTQWDRDMLLRDVLDSRLVNTATGEIVDETPLDKVLQVWNLGAPRITALRARNIDAEQYCRSEWGGWSIELLT